MRNFHINNMIKEARRGLKTLIEFITFNNGNNKSLLKFKTKRTDERREFFFHCKNSSLCISTKAPYLLDYKYDETKNTILIKDTIWSKILQFLRLYKKEKHKGGKSSGKF